MFKSRRKRTCDGLVPVCFYQGHSPIRQWKKPVYKAAVTVVTSVIIGSAVLYKQIQLIQRKLRLTTDVFDTEKRSSYIYVRADEETENGQTNDVHTSWTWRARERTKKGLWLPWLQSRILSYDPWTLLRLAKSDEQSVRLVGVRTLAEQHSWNDAQYQTVAQALDSRTLVGLARSFSADRRFFLPMPAMKPTDTNLEDDLRNLVSCLSKDNIDACTAHLCKMAMTSKQPPQDKTTENVWLFESNVASEMEDDDTEVTMKTPSLHAELACLHALLALSRSERQCTDLVRHGGLCVLQRVYETCADQRTMTEYVARILANVSRHEALRDSVIAAGWVSVLAGWMRSCDLALCQHATKTLHHLDSDEAQDTYADSVYLYYPAYRQRTPICADIVFVHGLMGGPFKTWRQRDPETRTKLQKYQPLQSDWTLNSDQDVDTSYTQCWPRDWLSKDCPHARILTVEYDTRLSDWPRRNPDLRHQRSILSRSASLLDKLREAGLGNRPIVWVGHSMGGLLIKQMLLLAAENTDDNDAAANVVTATRGIIFYSVPHQGSPLAARSGRTKYVWYPSIEVQELKEGSLQLQSLQHGFKDLALKSRIPIVSFCEGRKCQLPFNIRLMLVPPRCSDAEIGKHYVMSNLTHMTICKPDSRQSHLYHLTRDFITDCLPVNPT